MVKSMSEYIEQIQIYLMDILDVVFQKRTKKRKLRDFQKLFRNMDMRILKEKPYLYFQIQKMGRN